MGDDRLGGYRLPKGWMAFVIPYVLHRLPAYWPNPDAFDPDRFSPEHSADRPKFVYVPFGAGPRACVGLHFASVEGLLLLALIGCRYDLRLAQERVELQFMVTLRPKGGLWMVRQPRITPVVSAAHVD